ncbi:DUF6216 family protein [Acidovorax sp. SUPP3334]|uniref:DUF6216 family protein n=1 Tax=Acidovorax sp. SUPP3334 TaxID=2920881 RepID=UPI0023DE2AC3|nr:DUF6216 family protein [Acidovorax sp. SUPP3334]GKT26716.1 DUF6216 family protein [Acidovorax sp. SUPP3334]
MENAGIGELSKSIVAWLPLALPLILLVMFVWVILRSESWHLLRRRTWQLVHGKGGITDPALQGYVEEQTNLAAFRVFVGVPVTTMADAHTLMEWCRVYSVSLETLRLCRQYFDVETRSIKAKKRYLTIKGNLWGICAMASLVVAALSFQLITLPYAGLILKDSGQHFLASDSQIRAVWPPFGAPTLTAKDCVKEQDAAALRLGFSPGDVALICKMLSGEEFRHYARKALFEQRIGLFLWGVFMLALMYFLATAARSCMCASKLLQRQIPSWLPAGQMTLNFDAR